MNYTERYQKIIGKHIGKDAYTRAYLLEMEILDLLFEIAKLEGGNDAA